MLYRIGRWILRGALGFYFDHIERFHAEQVPAGGPVLFASNHPNSLTDAFVIGTAVSRKVNFVATVQLFRLAPARWLLEHCGVIAINRVKDNPRAMRSVRDSFEACFQVLERGEAVAIFPEGITHDDPQLKAVKTGTARMALELEQRYAGKLGLRIAPVGLTFSAKELYRSHVLVNFGIPIPVADYLSDYQQNRHAGIQALNGEIERRIQALILHLPQLERARIVAAVKRLYLGKLRLGNTVIQEPVTPQAGELLLTQAIAKAVEATYVQRPERAAEFTRKLNHYERILNRFRLSDEVLAHFPDKKQVLARSIGWALLAICGAPLAVYGWLHRWIPYTIVQWIVRRAARPTDHTQVSTATLLGGLVVFTGFYTVCTAVCYRLAGWPAAFWYALSLPVSSLLAHYYAREVRRFGASLLTAKALLRAPATARRLLRERSELISLIEAEHAELLRARSAAQGPTSPDPDGENRTASRNPL